MGSCLGRSVQGQLRWSSRRMVPRYFMFCFIRYYECALYTEITGKEHDLIWSQVSSESRITHLYTSTCISTLYLHLSISSSSRLSLFGLTSCQIMSNLLFGCYSIFLVKKPDLHTHICTHL